MDDYLRDTTANRDSMVRENMSPSSEHLFPDGQPPVPPPGSDAYWEMKFVCPCKKCANRKLTKRRLLDVHLQRNGRHTPPLSTPESSHNDDIKFDGQEQNTPMDGINEVGVNEPLHDHFTTDGKVDNSPLTQLAGTPLYPDAKISVQETVTLLWNLKVTHGLTDTSFTALLRLLADEILPKENKMPRSIGELSSVMKNTGIDMAVHEPQKTPQPREKETSRR